MNRRKDRGKEKQRLKGELCVADCEAAVMLDLIRCFISQMCMKNE